MKELWETIITAYNNYRGTGKGLTLFLVSVLIICLLRKDDTGTDEGQVSPLAFILNPLAGIGYAFTRALYRYRAKSVPAGILAGALVIITLILSGGWVFSDKDHYLTENAMHIRQEYVDVMNTLLESGDGTIRVVAPPGLSPYMKAYSGRFDVMYGYPENGDPKNLGSDAGYVYEQMSLSVPDQARVVETIRKEGYDHILYDSRKTFFSLPFEEYDYELVGEVSGFRIYRDRKGTGAGSLASAADKFIAAASVVLCAAFAVLCIVIALRTKREEKGKEGTLLRVLVTVLIVCQTAGVMIFSYDDPAGLPNGVCTGTGFLIIYSLLPLFIIPAYYYAYFRLARRLFKDGSRTWFMMLIICVLNLWGYQSEPLLPATMLYCWFAPASVILHGLLPLALCSMVGKWTEAGKTGDVPDMTEENDYYMWEEEEMKNHKIINSRNLAIALILVIILFAGSVFVMNRKINNLYNTTVELQQQVEEMKKSE